MWPWIIGGIITWLVAKWSDSDETVSGDQGAPVQAQFVLHVENGRVTKVEGQIMDVTVSMCNDVLRGIYQAGAIAGVLKDGRRLLQFSGDFSEQTKQRIRNVIVNS